MSKYMRAAFVLVATTLLVGKHPVAARAQGEPQGYARAVALVNALSPTWETWAPIPNFKEEAYVVEKDGTPIQVAKAKGHHADTQEYGHVDVALAYVFDQREPAYVQVTISSMEFVAVRGDDGKLFVPLEVNPSVTKSVSGELESLTLECTMPDGTKIARTFKRPAGIKA